MVESATALKLLRFAKEKRKFKLRDVCESLGVDCSPGQSLATNVLVCEIVAGINNGQLFSHIQGRKLSPSDTCLDYDLYCSVRDEIRLLEYEKLEQARADSVVAGERAELSIAKANASIRVAVVSVVISILLTTISIYQSYKSKDSVVNLPSELIQNLEKITQANVETVIAVNDLIKSNKASEHKNSHLLDEINQRLKAFGEQVNSTGVDVRLPPKDSPSDKGQEY